jgi:hypothetical protein
MFDEIFFPRTAEKHRAAPLAEPRARYLRHLKEIGARRSVLRKCANDHLNLVRLLNPQGRRPDQHSRDRDSGGDLVSAEGSQMRQRSHCQGP